MMSAKTSIAAAALSLAALSPVASSADPTVASCSPKRVKYIASGVSHFRTTSTSYIDLPQAQVTFRQGGARASCVLVRFSANPQANRNMGFRAMLDGGEAALPFEGQISDGVDIGPIVRRFTFIFPSVAPGSHSISIQYQMTSPGGMVDMNAHNTIVQFTP